jgi:hypothetical protein
MAQVTFDIVPSSVLEPINIPAPVGSEPGTLSHVTFFVSVDEHGFPIFPDPRKLQKDMEPLIRESAERLMNRVDRIILNVL